MHRPSETAAMRALDSMVRMRLLEAPPDAHGHRRVWHHGFGGAELVSTVDAKGHVIAQELALLGDFVAWHHGSLIRTGALPVKGDRLEPPRESEADFDVRPDRERVERIRHAFEGYDDADRYLRHMHHVVDAARAAAFSASEIVTRQASDVEDAWARVTGVHESRFDVRPWLAAAGIVTLLVLLIWELLRSRA